MEINKNRLNVNAYGPVQLLPTDMDVPQQNLKEWNKQITWKISSINLEWQTSSLEDLLEKDNCLYTP